MNNEIKIIAAVENNTWAIGDKNELLYHIPEDMRRFKKLTTDHDVLMGWNTFKSLPNGPLPNRHNIVLVEELPEEDYENVTFITSIDDIESARVNTEVCLYVIGGASVYRQFIEIADEVLLTIVSPYDENDYHMNADAHFPADVFELYEMINSPISETGIHKFEKIYQDKDNKRFNYEFYTFKRKQPVIEETPVEE